MKKSRRLFTKDFKLEALSLTKDRPASQIANELGISKNTLANWKKQLKSDPLSSFPGNGKLKPQDEEMRKLKREVEHLRQERDILKKALAIFSAPQR